VGWSDPPLVSEPQMPAGEVDRVEHTRLRRRLLYGLGREDVRARVKAQLRSEARADAWGEPDLTGLIFAPACKALSMLYAPEPPRPTAPDARGDLVLDAAQQGGLWELMIRGQRDTIGLREVLVRVDALEDPTAPLGWSLAYRLAYPDRVVARPRASATDLPGWLAEAVLMQLDTDPAPRWYWDEWAIEGPGAPYHVVRTEAGREVVREAGDAYPYWDEDGLPVLPYSLYHAERTGLMFDPWEWLEVVEGALNLCVLWTFYGHLIRNASWPQRYMAGAMVSADTGDGDDGGTPGAHQRVRVAADPALVLMLAIDPESTGQPVIGQWAPASDPDKVAESISKYERRLSGMVGIDPASVQKVSGDPRSGYAISVSRDSQIEAQRRFAPQFRRGDLETLRVSAAVLGSAAGAKLPGTGYAIEYGPEVLEEEMAAEGTEGAVPGAAAVQDTALNGAQVTALMDLVTKVAAGQLPRDAAIAIAQRAFQVTADEASALLGSAGDGFKITAGADDGAGRQAGGGAADAAGDGGGEADGGGDGGGGAAQGDGGAA
jgi:hypothetical protein